MRKTLLLQVTAIGLGLLVVLTVVFLSGCSKEKPLISPNIDELSLADMWEAVVKTTGLQEPDNACLESMNLRALNRKLQQLDFAFYTSDEPEVTMYHIFFDQSGKLDYFYGQVKNGSNMPLTFNPEIVFYQIDRFGLTNIRPTVSGFTIDIRKQPGVKYVDKPFPLYHLEDGILTPLALVELSSERPGLPVRVGSIARDEPPKGHFETYTLPEYWFLSEDLNRAETVEYLKPVSPGRS